MKMVKSLLLGSAAGLVAVAGAQAADLPVKAAPVQYVKICSLYGAGFFYIPGTDTCIKIGGYVRAEANYQANGSFKPQTSFNFDSPDRNREISRARAVVSFDVRSQTAYGTLRSYALFGPTDTPGPAASVGATGYGSGTGIGGSPYMPIFAPAFFIQFAGFTFGKTASFFDFDLQPYSNQTNLWGSNQAGNGEIVFAYTAQFGGGFSASISAEDTSVRRSSITGAGFTYQGRRWPDVVANLRVDQAWGSAQVMGAIHDTAGWVTGTTTTDANIGWALGAGLRINLPTWGKGDYILGQFSYADGAMNYVASQFGAGGLGAMNLQEGFPGPSKIALGPFFDAVATSATTIENTKGWSVTGGYEHRWNPQWKTSLYGSYGQVDYTTAAGTVIAGLIPSTNADWSMWQVGSRTVWTPVSNLDLSLDLLWTDVNKSAFDGASCAGITIAANGSGPGAAGCTFDSKGIFSAMVRAQRNFWP